MRRLHLMLVVALVLFSSQPGNAPAVGVTAQVFAVAGSWPNAFVLDDMNRVFRSGGETPEWTFVGLLPVASSSVAGFEVGGALPTLGLMIVTFDGRVFLVNDVNQLPLDWRERQNVFGGSTPVQASTVSGVKGSYR